MTARRTTFCFLGSLSLLLSVAPAFAATRTVYFNATGTNRTQEGLAAVANSTCKITVSNPSTQSEIISLTITANSINSWVGGAISMPKSASPLSCTLSGDTSTCNTITLSAGASQTFTVTYSDFAARTPSTAADNKRQDLRCTGKITVSDSAQAGFVIASGVLVTFVESARMHTDGNTSGTSSTTTFGGIPVYSQIPIPINRSKPF